MRRKVLLIADFQESGGTFTYFKQLLALLELDRDLQIEVLLKPQQLKVVHQLQQAGSSNVTWSTFNVPELRLSKYAGCRLNYYLQFILRCAFWAYCCVARRPSLVIHSTGGEFHYPLFILPVKFLAIQHSSQLRQFNRLNRFILNVFLSKRKRILTVSQFSEKCIVESGMIRENKRTSIGHIHNFHPESSPVCRTDQTFTVLTIGHVVEYKNPAFWLDVAKAVSDRSGGSVKFSWAGSGEQLDLFREKSEAYENIAFLGHRDNVSELYSNCDLYFQPSLLESHGIAVLGAMSHGLPCVVSDVGGLPESVIDSETGFVYQSGNLCVAIDKVLTLVEDVALGRRLGMQGRKRFEDKFCLSKWIAKMKQFLHLNYEI